MPKKQNGYSRVKANRRDDLKRHQAWNRQDAHDTLTVKEKIAKVEWRRANGMGESKRELARLTKAQLDAPPFDDILLPPTPRPAKPKKTYQKPKKS